MKKLVLLVLSSLIVVTIHAQANKKELIAKLFSGVMVMTADNIDAQSPIASINELASIKADKSEALTKDNIKTLLTEAKSYSWVYITVGDHTIVKITSLDDCKPSGAWGACMPMGEGYIQKGELKPKTDYINFIVGIPDGQKRMIFMFK